MARHHLLIAFVLHGFICVGLGQERGDAPKENAAPPVATAPVSKSENIEHPDRPRGRRGDTQRARKFLESLNPEERARARTNLERWRKMPQEERKQLRERERKRKEKMRREIDQAIKDSGVQLADGARAGYAQRYMQQRRRIEQELRNETEAKRKTLVAELVDQLKKEFSAPAAPSAPPTPVP